MKKGRRVFQERLEHIFRNVKTGDLTLWNADTLVSRNWAHVLSAFENQALIVCDL